MALSNLTEEEKKKKLMALPIQTISERANETRTLVDQARNTGGLGASLGTVINRTPGDVNSLIDNFFNAAGKGAVRTVDAAKNFGNAIVENPIQSPTPINTNLQNIQKPADQTNSSNDLPPNLNQQNPPARTLPTIEQSTTPRPVVSQQTPMVRNYDSASNTTGYAIGGNTMLVHGDQSGQQGRFQEKALSQPGNPGSAFQQDYSYLQKMQSDQDFSKNPTYIKNNDGSYTTNSGLNVKFDNSVSQDNARAFLNGPPESGYTKQSQQPLRLATMEPPSSKGFTITTPSISKLSEPEYITREEAKKMGIGWKSRNLMNANLSADYHNQLSAQSQQYTADSNAATAANTARENALANMIEQQNRSINDKEKNRLDEMNITGQNKLRDIQGQVMQAPPVKESALKPIVVKVPDPTDPMGTRMIEEIRMPNAEGTGYLNNQQTALEVPTEAAKELMIKNKNNPAYVDAYTKRFGKLPY